MRRRDFLAAAAGIVVAAAACTAPSAARAAAPPGAMPNGLYKVVADPSPRAEPPAIWYDPRLADPASTVAPRWVTVDRTDYVPLVLAAAPRGVPQADGRLSLEIALAPEHVATLEGFTRRNVGGRGAVVLDGEILSVHKLRAVVTSGRMQITRCTDRACERIQTKLRVDGGS